MPSTLPRRLQLDPWPMGTDDREAVQEDLDISGSLLARWKGAAAQSAGTPLKPVAPMASSATQPLARGPAAMAAGGAAGVHAQYGNLNGPVPGFGALGNAPYQIDGNSKAYHTGPPAQVRPAFPRTLRRRCAGWL